MSKVSDTYKSPDDFKLMLETAQQKVNCSREEDFVAGLVDRFEQWGMDTFLTDSQDQWLTNIVQRN